MNIQPCKIATTPFTAVVLSSAMLVAANAKEKASAREGRGSSEQRSSANADPVSQDMLRVAADDTDNRNLRYFTRKDVRGIGGQDLGTIKDFLVKADSGKLAYAVVSSGGILGVAETLRLVPAESLHWDHGNGSFNVDIDRARWEQLSATSKQHYNAGSIMVDAEQHRQMEQYFGVTARAETGGIVVADLLRASNIRGKRVRAGEREVGEIEEVVIDLQNRKATALLDPDSDFASTDRKFMVPLSRLSFGYNEEDPAMTRLTRADFGSAQPAAHAISSESSLPASNITGASGISQSSVTGQTGYSSAQTAEAATTDATDSDVINERDVQLTPTGGSSAQQNPTTDSTLALAAQSVRQALDHTPSLAKADIEVLPQNGKLMLRGSVETEALKQQVADAAGRAAPGVEIENRVVLKNK